MLELQPMSAVLLMSGLAGMPSSISSAGTLAYNRFTMDIFGSLTTSAIFRAAHCAAASCICRTGEKDQYEFAIISVAK